MGWLGPISELIKSVGSSAISHGAKSTLIHKGYEKLTGGNKSTETTSTPAEVNVQPSRLEESKSRKAIRDINQEESNVNKDIRSDVSDLKKIDQEINSINNDNTQDSEDTSELAQLELLKELDKTRSELDYEKSLSSVYNESNDKKVLELESKLTDLNSKYKNLYLNKSKVDPVKSKSKSKLEKSKNLQALSDKANVEGFKLVNDELEMLRLKQQEDMINLQMKLNQSGLAGSGKQVQSTNNAEQHKSFMSTLMSSIVEYAAIGLVGYVGKMYLNRTATGRGIKAFFKGKIRNLKNNSPVVRKVADFFGKKGAERSASQKAADKARREATKQAARKIEKEGIKEVEEQVGKKAAKKLSIKGLGGQGKKYAEKLFGKISNNKVIKAAEKKVFKIAGKKVTEEALEEAGEKIVTQAAEKAGGKALRSALLRISEKIAVRAGTSLSLASTGVGAIVSIGMLAYDVFQIGSSMNNIRLVIARLKELKEDTWRSLVRKNLTIKMINDNEWDSDDLELINSLVGMAKSTDKMTLGTLIFYLEVENLNKIASPLTLDTSTSIKD